MDYQTELPDVDVSNYIVNKSYKISLTKDVCYMSINDYRFVETFVPIVNEIFGTSLKNYGEIDDFFGDFA